MKKTRKGRLLGLISALTAILLCLTASAYATSVCPLNIPADPVTMVVDVNEYNSCNILPTLSPQGYFNATFSNIPGGYSIANGMYTGYCSELAGSILDNPLFGNVVYQAQFWSSLDTNIPSALKDLTFTDENNVVHTYTIPWDKINYVINTYPNESWLNLQPVIWTLVHGCSPQTSLFDCSPVRQAPYYFPYGGITPPYGCPNLVDLSKVASIVNDANTNGAGFIPTPGQKLAMVVQATDCTPASICNQYLPFQITFISVTCPNACIDIKKEISVDNGATWYDSNTVDDAPPMVTPPHGALYRLVVSNCGDVDLTDVVINDQTLGISSYAIGNLAAGASRTLTSEAIPQLLVATACSEEGAFENVATVSGKAYGTPVEASNSAWLLCSPPQGTNPSLSIDKTCSGSCSSYTYTRRVKKSCTSSCSYSFSATVENTGDETIENITCKDNPDVPLTGVQSSLAPGESFTVTGTTKASSDTLTCSGQGAVSKTPISSSGTATCTVSNVRPAIDVKKYVSADGRNWSDANFPPGITVNLCSTNTYCGAYTRKSEQNSTVHKECYGGYSYSSNCGKVYFKFVTKNTGNAALTNIALADSAYPLTRCTVPNTLNPNGSFTCVIGPITAEAGQHKDTATASGYYNGTKYQDTDDAYYSGYRKTSCR